MRASTGTLERASERTAVERHRSAALPSSGLHATFPVTPNEKDTEAMGPTQGYIPVVVACRGDAAWNPPETVMHVARRNAG